MVATKRPLGVRAISGLVIGLIAMVPAGCGVEEKPIGFRYRLTVEVDTPEGLKTGSSVIEVAGSVASSGRAIVRGPGRLKPRGEAVAVDLPGGQTLFALLRSENEVDWATNIILLHSPKYRGKDSFETTVREIRRNKRLRVLPPVKRVAHGRMKRDGWPMLVTFDDLSDPKSVKKIDPASLADAFGEGVSLKRITAQVTEDPVTTGIVERLGWLPNYYNKQLSGDRFQNIRNKDKGLSAFMSAGVFSAGLGVKSKRGNK